MAWLTKLRKKEGYAMAWLKDFTAVGLLTSGMIASLTVAIFVPAPTSAQTNQPNILVIWGDDIGQSNISAYTFGVVGYRTPNIDRIAKEGMMFTDFYPTTLNRRPELEP